MKRFVFFILVFFVFFSCQEDKVPEYVIPPDDMVSILVDIHLTDGMLSSPDVRRELARQDTANIYHLLLHNYGYSRKDFDTSLFYYGKNIALYDRIYNDVLNQLNELETQLKEESQESEQNKENE
ncbi:MAG: DUF4296 domain-containing protein [Bacteroidales bacterium]|jgi:hypothetical protein|nr:DUF4296 domain-containing protein [Bacteroidales bacterium]